MTRLLRLVTVAALVLAGLVTPPAPAAAVSAGCSTISDTGAPLGPGKLFVQASYGEDAVTLFRFYLTGPETVVVYEGHSPRSFAEVVSGLTPGAYQWRLHATGEGVDGKPAEADFLLATCTVNGLVEVPVLRGETPADAAALLERAGLQVGSTSSAYSSSVAKGAVAKTNPSAGSAVSPGTRVDLVISAGPAPVATPQPTTAPTPKPTPTSTPVAAPTESAPVAIVTVTAPPSSPTIPSPAPTASAAPTPPVASATELPAFVVTLPFWLVALLVLLLRLRG